MNGAEKRKAWDEWFASEDGKRCAEHETLFDTIRPQQDLDNRLWRAFLAGVDAATLRQKGK